MIEPASCQLVSIDNEPSHGLNRIFLRQGRHPISAGRNEVIASESFAKAHNLRPGDQLNVTMDGRKETIRIVGIGLSPEYVYAVQPGLLLTDNRRFGVLWMPRRQMEAAFNIEGAFNSVTIAMQPKASTAEVIYQMDRILKPYGGHGACHSVHFLVRRFLPVQHCLNSLGPPATRADRVASGVRIHSIRNSIALLQISSHPRGHRQYPGMRDRLEDVTLDDRHVYRFLSVSCTSS